MAAPREPAWTTHEKNALLAEIIKVNAPPPAVLLEVIQRMNMSPRLEEVPLPPGRSLNSCRNALEALRRDPALAVAMTPGSTGLQASSPMSAPLTQGKRPFPFENTPMQQARYIAPKPMRSGAYGATPSQIEQPPKKKRGRPTKAEAQAKAEAQSMAGESISVARPPVAMMPIATPMPAAPPELPQPAQTPVEERRESMPAVSRMNISSMLAATPAGTGSASHSSSSSGKRRRGRSTRSEASAIPQADPSGPTEQYESPYADSPARAAMMRRREEPRIEEEQQQSGVQQSTFGYQAPRQQQQQPRPPAPPPSPPQQQ